MKKSCFTVAFFIVSLMLHAQIASPPETGSGTSGDPYQITSLNELFWIAAPDYIVPSPTHAQRMSSYYLLMNDIDASATASWFSGLGWWPIGTSSTPFIGHFDGQFFTISNLTLNRTTSEYMGMFGAVGNFANYNGARTIQNLTLTNVDIRGKGRVGGLIGTSSQRCIVHNCHVTGYISGVLSGPHISERIYIGGLIGRAYETRVAYSSVNATVQGSRYVGGLIGHLAGSSDIMDGYWAVEKSFSTGSVTAPEGYTGGLIGEQGSFILRMSYSRSAVTGTDYFVGGLIGYLSGGGVWQVYSTGMVSGSPYPDYMGGLIGFKSSSNNIGGYWDTQTSGQATSQGGYGRTTAQMKTQATYVEGYWPGYWGTVWTISSSVNNGYPALVAYLPAMPEVETNEVTEILPHKANLNGTLISTGIPVNILEHGFCWNTSGNPDINDNKINLGIRSSTGEFTASLEGLQGLTTYYLRAYARNSTGLVYGSEKSFTTLAGSLPPGEGTTANPYRISNLNHLQWMCNAKEWDKHYIQTANIDAQATADWNEGSGFAPIGTAENPFTGTYNGKRFNIHNLTISRPLESNVGLFGYANGATYSWIYLYNVSILGNNQVGSLTGNANNCTIKNCFTRGTVHGYSNIGGIAGNTDLSSITNCTNETAISFNVSAAGGIAGQNGENSSIESCTNDGTITALSSMATCIGGIAGKNYGEIILSNNYNELSGYVRMGGIAGENFGQIDKCSNTSNITGGDGIIYVGGIAGTQFGSANTTRSYNTGDITAGNLSSQIGGLIGSQTANNYLDNCYNLGNIIAPDGFRIGGAVGYTYESNIVNVYSIGTITASDTEVGGLVGKSVTSNVTGSFWNTETSTLSTSDGGTGLTTAQMKDMSIYTTAGWSFVGDGTRSLGCSEDCWDMDLSELIANGYPYLGAQQVPITWNGNSNADWEKPQNWSGSLSGPTEYKEVIIPSTSVSPEITNPSSSPAKCSRLTIESGGQLTIKPLAALTVGDSISNSGLLLIESNETGTGSLLHYCDSVNATIQLSVSGGQHGRSNLYNYHLIAIPILDSLICSPTFLNTYLWYLSPNAGVEESWIGIQNADTMLDTKAGYLGYVAAPRKTYSFDGLLNNDSLSPSIQTTLQGNYNLVPNPYPSAIDWDLVDLNNSKLEPSIWFFDSESGNYIAYNDGDPVGGNIIPVGQSVFVKASDDFPELHLDNSIRLHHDQSFYKNQIQVNQQKIAIKVSTSNGNDQLTIRFREDANDSYNTKNDATKLYGFSGTPQFYSLSSDNIGLSINTMALDNIHDSVDLVLEYETQEPICLYFDQLESFQPEKGIYLEDKLYGSIVNLRNNQTYCFDQMPEFSSKRFRVHIKELVDLSENESDNSFSIWAYHDYIYFNIPAGRGENVILEIYNLLGKLLEYRSIKLNSNMNLQSSSHGILIVQIRNNEKVYRKKIFIP